MESLVEKMESVKHLNALCPGGAFEISGKIVNFTKDKVNQRP